MKITQLQDNWGNKRAHMARDCYCNVDLHTTLAPFFTYLTYSLHTFTTQRKGCRLETWLLSINIAALLSFKRSELCLLNGAEPQGSEWASKGRLHP
ncbi:hypothetical protein FKM82_026406 [Ascaphus truei]